MTPPDFLFNGPDKAPFTVVLAHGAGAPMDSTFMKVFAEELAARGHRVARFEFPYMTQRRVTGIKRPPDRAPILLETWHTVIEALGGPDKVVIGGKSMGGRIATMVAAELERSGTPVKGVVALGYPFHPPGRPEKTRVEHLQDLQQTALFLQGERDTLGNLEDVKGYTLPKSIRFHWLADGDHGFKPRKKSGRTETENWTEAIDAFNDYLNNL